MMANHFRNIGDRVKYARGGGIPILRKPFGGTIITLETAKKLKELVFGTFTHTVSEEWFKTSFTFQPPESKYGFGLVAPKNGTKAAILCVQSYVLKNLMLMTANLESQEAIEKILNPARAMQEEALYRAISDVIWKCGLEESKCALVLPVEKESPFADEQSYKPDGVTELLQVFEFTSHKELLDFMKKYFYYFLKDTCAGVLLVLYSALLSRGLDKVVEDLNDEYSVLVTPQGDVNYAVITLLLIGSCTPYLHNGVKEEDIDEKLDAVQIVSFFKKTTGGRAKRTVTKVGVTVRTDVGFLLWKHDSDSPIEIGSRLKTPTTPVWLTCAEDQYGILFHPSKDLMRDHKAEHKFDLYYYNSSSSQEVPALLTLDTRFGRPEGEDEDDDYDLPVLQKVIMTKWGDAKVDWNGTTPYV